MKRKLLCLAVALLMIVCAFPLTANAASSIPWYNWTEYDSNYPWTFYPVSGSYCSSCKANSVTWDAFCQSYHCNKVSCFNHPTSVFTTSYCKTHTATPYAKCTYCNAWYCPSCSGGYHTYNSATGSCSTYAATYPSYLCNLHLTYNVYCTYCQKYYCPTCVGGNHVYNAVLGKCVVTPFTPSSCSLHVGTALMYCNICKVSYCPACTGGYHFYNAVTGKCSIVPASSSVCSIHGNTLVYCSTCKISYCPDCTGGYHVYNSATGKCERYYFPPVNWPNYPDTSYPFPYPYYPYYDYYYLNPGYIYVPGYGFIIPDNTAKCPAPTASIPSGTVIETGTSVTLSCSIANAKIYYTTNGATPTVNSTLYTGPIKITSDIKITAIAVYSGMLYSSPAYFSYTVKAPKVNFTDIKNYPGLADSLAILVDKGVIDNSSSFDPTGTVSYTDFKEWFAAIGVVIPSKVVNESIFADSNKLTYEELIYASYRTLFENALLKSLKTSNEPYLSQFKYRSEMTSTALYKSAYSVMLYNETLYGTDFKPGDSATRTYLATILAYTIGKL